MKLTTTVVLTTYNGIRFLKPLVDSLRLQSRKINEVLIFDDGSSDETAVFLRKYIDGYQLNDWKVYVNSPNKGWKKNFRDGILSASGDLIFPCDQDDIWDLNKIEIMAKCFEENQNMMLLSSDYTPLYEEGGKKVDSFEDNGRSAVPTWIKDDEKFSVHLRPGCVMCVRKSFVENLREEWEEDYAHDAFLWTAATLAGGNYLIRKPLIQFRRHANNTSTGTHRTKENQIALMEMGAKVVKWYMRAEERVNSEKMQMLDGYMQWYRLRMELLQRRRIINFFKLIPYHSYFRSTRQELGDLYYILKR